MKKSNVIDARELFEKQAIKAQIERQNLQATKYNVNYIFKLSKTKKG